MRINLLLAALLSSASAHAGPADWDALGREAAAHLSSLVRIDTSNPPGNELEACRYLAGALDGEGVPYEILESTAGRASLVARLAGDGSRRPLLLLAHLDTVGVEDGRWSFPPFAGDQQGGYLRGRGSIDDKSMAAAFLTAVLWLKRSGAALKRDVVFAALADEESGGELGLKRLLARRPELLDAEYAVNEGGTTLAAEGRVRLVAVQTLEKAYYDVRLTARSSGGHAAVPRPENAIHVLARALARLEAWERPLSLNEVTRAHLSALLPLEKAAARRAILDVLSEEPERVERGRRALKRHPYYLAMLQDTVVPTLVSGGLRENVLPAEAWTNLNVRLLPDTDPDAFLENLNAVIDEPSIDVSVAGSPDGLPPPPMPLDNAFFQAVRRVAEGLSPGAVVVPSMSAGSTDSERLRRRGVLTYGLQMPLAAEDEARIHGIDERMPLAGLAWGTRFLTELVLEVSR